MEIKHKLTNLDRDQITRHVFDEEHQAQRVVIAGASGIAESIKEGLSGLVVTPTMDLSELREVIQANQNQPVSTTPEIRIETVQVPQIIVQKEIEIKEIQTEKVIIQTEYKEIQVPVVVKEIEVIRTEIPVVVKELQVVEIAKADDKYLKILILINSLAILVLFILNLLKK